MSLQYRKWNGTLILWVTARIFIDNNSMVCKIVTCVLKREGSMLATKELLKIPILSHWPCRKQQTTELQSIWCSTSINIFFIIGVTPVHQIRTVVFGILLSVGTSVPSPVTNVFVKIFSVITNAVTWILVCGLGLWSHTALTDCTPVQLLFPYTEFICKCGNICYIFSQELLMTYSRCFVLSLS